MRNEGVTIDVTRSKYPTSRNGIRNAGLVPITDNGKASFVWVDGVLTRDEALDLEPYQKCNKIPGMDYICYKSTLFTALNDISKYYPQQFNVYPKTYNLPQDFLEFQREHMNICSRTTVAPTWVIKPRNSCCGSGILIVQSVHDAQQFNAQGVIQQYVKPFLIGGKKFDFRFYILIASIDPLRVFLYQEGITRFCTEPFQMPSRANRDDKFIHLTNTAINVENTKESPETFTKKASVILEEIERTHRKGKYIWNRVKEAVRAVIVGIVPKVVTILPRPRENLLLPELLLISKREKERKKEEERMKAELLLSDDKTEEEAENEIDNEKNSDSLPPLKKPRFDLYKKNTVTIKPKDFRSSVHNLNLRIPVSNLSLIQSNTMLSSKKKELSLTGKKNPVMNINREEECCGDNDTSEEISPTSFDEFPEQLLKKESDQPKSQDPPSLKMRHRYFHILGIDVILDSDLEPKILELNDRPSLSVTVEFEKELKESFITECFEHVSTTNKSFGNSERSKWEQVYPMDPEEKDSALWQEIVKKALNPKSNGEIEGVVVSQPRAHSSGIGSTQFAEKKLKKKKKKGKKKSHGTTTQTTVN